MKLDETEGNIAHDRFGRHDGTLIGGPVWQPTGGKLNGALQFDGTDDYVNAGCVLDPADGAFSAFAWIKGGEPGEVIISQTDAGGFGSTWLGMSTSNGKLCTSLCWFERTAELVITDDRWHHIGLVWNGSRRYLYGDGEMLVGDTTDQMVLSSPGNLHFGVDRNLTAGTFWTGLIGDVRICNRPLSPDEVAALAD